MEKEIKSNVDQLEEIGKASRKIPDRPPYSPILPETSEMCSEANSKDIKNEPPDAEESNNTQTDENTAQSVTTEILENLVESAEYSDGGEENVLEKNAVVKKGPVREKADFNIPMSKTLLNTSDTQSAQITDNESTSLGTTDDIGKENNTHLHENADSAALDALLDGIGTPMAHVRPRLRVKTEFALMKTPRREPSPTNDIFDKDNDAMETDFLPPPAPALFSSNSNSDYLEDGIATPRISLAAINRQNRIFVKTEFSLPPGASQPNNEDFFEDISVCQAEDREAGEVSPRISNEDDASEDEPIPDNFFDDLLRDKIKERIQDAQNNDLEEKYSDRLKELERLKRAEEKLKERRKNHKKQKKSKKKSKKRPRSHSLSPSNRAKDRNRDDASNHDHDKNKRVRISPSPSEMTSSYVHTVPIDENFSRVDARIRIKSELSENDSENIAKENVEEEIEVLTPKQRRNRAIKRATALLNHLKKTSGDNSTTAFSTFTFVSTVRKLPTSNSYFKQQFYEKRSPLHKVNNVKYKFNSLTTRFNMEEWGLEALPEHAAKLAKRVGCNAQFIYDKLKTIKIPAKLKKVKSNKEVENEEEEELIETSSSLYSNVMTQTDEISEFDMQHEGNCCEIGVQVEPRMFSIGSQTLETESPTEDLHKDDEAPIMKILHDLNENQLMAIHAFAEFIKEPKSSANAMEMYKIQIKILDIYKMSQIPSALDTAQPPQPIVNNYTTMTTRSREPPSLCIQSVKGADGKQFSVNDPRSNSTSYNNRIAYDDAGSSTKYDHWRKTYSQSSHARPLSNDGFPQSSHGRPSGNPERHYSSHSTSRPTYNNHSLPTTTKHYGRGALRR